MTKARTLADFISDGSPLADGTISVSEVSGAAPLANPTFTGTASGTFSGPLTGNVTGDVTGDVTGNITGNVTGNVTGDVAGEVDLSALAATISDTAVDVFVYDTSKDSDGGAWRKRTQGTSWYNETLNTATRGSRKEFPSVAVIVAESNQVTIYDGDDPSLPMWMVFNQGSDYRTYLARTQAAVTSVSALNGVMAVGRGNGAYDEALLVMSFIEDGGKNYGNSANSTWTLLADIANRNTTGINLAFDPDFGQIVNLAINDVAMTVLPNAPIDAATGLPVPTIAVATDGGVSVIKDDGTVVDVMTSNSYGVAFTKNYELVHTVNDASSTFTNHIREIPSADTTTTAARRYFRAGNNTGSIPSISATSGEGTANILATLPNNTLAVASGGTQSALNILQEVPNAPTTGMVAYTTSTYNTGWMNGDIKLATLSDTDDTDVTGSELVTNGTFDTDTSGWASTGLTTSVSSGELEVTTTAAGHFMSQQISIQGGKTYTYSWRARRGTMSQIKISVYCATTGSNIISPYDYGATTSMADYNLTFTTPSNCTSVNVYVIRDSGTTGTAYFDDFSLRLAEEDRSVNGNGLQVFGTVTKNPVATGADLVAYSNASASDYLFQPYNSDLDFAGDFALTFWAKSNTTNQHTFFARQIPTTGSNSYGSTPYIFAQSNSSNTLSWYYRGTSSSGNYVSSATIRDNNWHHFCLMRSGGTMYAYIDGKLDGSFSFSESFANTSAPFFVGIHSYNDTLFRPLSDGGVSLFRISATAPSPEQIAKIYEDEKVLFQENAQATLYGSSDAVTALAYDDSTNLLHVGTSAGRSVFQRLRRVDNTTTAVGAAISASNGLVADE